MKAIRRGRTPWVASFVLRMFPFDDIATTLGNTGWSPSPTRAPPSCSAASPTARRWKPPSGRWKRAGSTPTAARPKASYHAELFLSRPQEEIERHPIQKLVIVVSGANKLWNVGANVLGSFGPTARRRARAEHRQFAEKVAS